MTGARALSVRLEQREPAPISVRDFPCRYDCRGAFSKRGKSKAGGALKVDDPARGNRPPPFFRPSTIQIMTPAGGARDLEL